MKDNGLLFLLLGVGGLVWYMSSQSPASSSNPQTSTGTGGGSAATPPITPTITQPAATAAASTPASYAGLSLAQMYSALQSIVASHYGTDPALGCQGTLSGLGVAVAGGGATGTSTANAPLLRDPSVVRVTTDPIGARLHLNSCVTPQATYDVFNYYLQQAVPSIQALPNAPSGDIVTLPQYWAWAAPLLQQSITGLTGLGSMLPLVRLPRPLGKVPKSYYYGGMSA